MVMKLKMKRAAKLPLFWVFGKTARSNMQAKQTGQQKQNEGTSCLFGIASLVTYAYVLVYVRLLHLNIIHNHFIFHKGIFRLSFCVAKPRPFGLVGNLLLVFASIGQQPKKAGANH